MIRLLTLATFVAAAFSISPAAEARTVPEGSYQDSCRNAYVDGDTLYGECKNNAGKYKKTWISGYIYCDGDLVNVNGVLDCHGGRKTVDQARRDSDAREEPHPLRRRDARDEEARDRYEDRDEDRYDDRDRRRDDERRPHLPEGPWVESCRDASIDGSVLRAVCRTDRGAWRQARLDVRNCDSDIYNNNGQLVCDRPATRARALVEPMRNALPSGDWVSVCRSAAVRDYQMRAECFDGDNQWWASDLNLKRCARNDVTVRGGVLRCR